MGYGPEGRGYCGQGRGKWMIITELLSLGGGTGTRPELNSLLSLPFFILVFWWYLYLSYPHTLLSLSLAPIFAKGWGMEHRGEGTVEKVGEREWQLLSYWARAGGPVQGPISTTNPTNTPSKRDRKGGEATKWIMEGHGKQTAYGFINCLSTQGYHIQVISYQHMHPCLELIN